MVYVGLAEHNGGILRNVSETGAAIQMLAPPRVGEAIALRFEMPAARVKIDARGQVVWTDSLGLVGVQFSQMSPGTQRQLREWMFTQLLASAERDCASAMFSAGGFTSTGLDFSRQARPAIALSAARRTNGMSRELGTLRFAWCPFELPGGKLSKCIDALILTCAVLLFMVTSLLTMRALPAWPLGLALVVGATAAFVAAYWLIFSFLTGITPGQHLARLAGQSAQNMEEMPRFR